MESVNSALLTLSVTTHFGFISTFIVHNFVDNSAHINFVLPLFISPHSVSECCF